MERRKFIKKSSVLTAGATMLPLIPGTAQAASRIIGANEKVTVGAIGINGMGMADLRTFLQQEGVECAALCDVDRNVLEKRAAETTELQGKKPDLYGDYRKLIERKDIDVVIIGLRPMI